MTAPEPRAELVEAGADSVASLYWKTYTDRNVHRAAAFATLAAVLPLLTPADVPHIEAAVRADERRKLHLSHHWEGSSSQPTTATRADYGADQ